MRNLVIAVFGLVVILVNFNPITAQERVRISPSSPGLASWPVQLAAKEGFFAREGLTAEVIVMRTNTGVAALATGSIDFTTAGGSALRAAVNGAPLKMVLNITKKADLWIVAQCIHRSNIFVSVKAREFVSLSRESLI
jgi:ABC-type nitrate/sulfonate/bicarbonate transport system substrate-binding protein